MAPPLAPDRIFFVPLATNNTSQRDRELQRAQALAHAARYSHRNRRERTEPCAEKHNFSYVHTFKQLPPIPRRPAIWRKNAVVSDAQLSERKLVSPVNCVLGQGRLDPFDTGAVSRLPHMVMEVLDYAYDVLWPSLFPFQPDVARFHAAMRRRLGREHEIVLHAHVFVTFAFTLGFRIFRNHPMWLFGRSVRQFHEARAVQLIEQQLQSTIDPPSDALLHASLLVCVIPQGPDTPTLDHYPSSPLATAQLLNIFATTELVPRRLRLIYDSVSRKGGSNEIHFQGLREIIHLQDLIRASRTGTKPVYLDWAWREEFAEAMSGQILDQQALNLSSCLGISFTCIEDPCLREALSMACSVTVALDQYHRKAPGSLNMGDLSRARNATQWLLCCLEPISVQESNIHVGLHNVCRLTTLIYSDMILFPIPKSNTVRIRLAGDLRAALGRCNPLENQDCQYNNLITWAVVMGGVAADDTPHRHWYAALLSRCLAARPSTWENLKSFLYNFLWWEFVLETPTLKLWDEAMR